MDRSCRTPMCQSLAQALGRRSANESDDGATMKTCRGGGESHGGTRRQIKAGQCCAKTGGPEEILEEIDDRGERVIRMPNRGRQFF